MFCTRANRIDVPARYFDEFLPDFLFATPDFLRTATDLADFFEPEVFEPFGLAKATLTASRSSTKS